MPGEEEQGKGFQAFSKLGKKSDSICFLRILLHNMWLFQNHMPIVCGGCKATVSALIYLIDGHQSLALGNSDCKAALNSAMVSLSLKGRFHHNLSLGAEALEQMSVEQRSLEAEDIGFLDFWQKFHLGALPDYQCDL